MSEVVKSMTDYKGSESVASDSFGELEVTGHDGDSLGVDGAEVGVLEEADEVGLSSFLKSKNGGALESEVALELLSNFSDESLEGELSDEELGGLLVSSDLSESNSSRTISVGLLHATVLVGGLSGSLATNVLSWGLATSVLSSGLLCTSHFN